MRERRAWGLGVVASIWLIGAGAWARPTLLADHEPGMAPSLSELELGVFSRSDADLYLPTVRFRHAFDDTVEGELHWPFALLKQVDQTMFFVTGNPHVGAHFVRSWSSGYARIGLGLGAPLSDAQDARAHIFGFGTQGMWDAWLYAPSAMSAVVPARIEVELDTLVVGAEFSGGALWHLGGGTLPGLPDDEEVVAQGAMLLGLRLGEVELGVKPRAVWLVTGSGDTLQTSVEPFAQWNASGGGFLYARVVLALDGPFGVLDSNRTINLWSAFLGGGTYFDTSHAKRAEPEPSDGP